MSVGKINISLLFHPSVIRGPCLITAKSNNMLTKKLLNSIELHQLLQSKSLMGKFSNQLSIELQLERQCEISICSKNQFPISVCKVSKLRQVFDQKAVSVTKRQLFSAFWSGNVFPIQDGDQIHGKMHPSSKIVKHCQHLCLLQCTALCPSKLLS